MRDNIYKSAEKYRDDIARFLADIVSIKSLSGEERAVVRRIADEMEKVGFDEVTIDDFGNVIGRIGSGSKKIAFDAHVDVVDEGDRSLWDFPPFEGKVADGKVFGRGSSDQKAGMASIVYAGKLLKELSIKGDFTFYGIGSVMEEDCDGLAWQYLVEKKGFRPDVVVLTEPTDLHIYRGHRGRMEMEVILKGKSAHGAFPHLGDNAIYKACNVVKDLEELSHRLGEDSFLGKGTLTVSGINGSGPSQCSVADFCSIYIDRRLTYGENEQSSIDEIKDLPSAMRHNATVHVPEYKKPTYTGYVLPTRKYYPTWVMEQENDFLKKAVSAYSELFNDKPVVDKWTFSTNGVAIAGMYNIPAFGFGPGIESKAHGPNEFCPVDHLYKAAAFYVSFLNQFGT